MARTVYQYLDRRASCAVSALGALGALDAPVPVAAKAAH